MAANLNTVDHQGTLEITFFFLYLQYLCSHAQKAKIIKIFLKGMEKKLKKPFLLSFNVQALIQTLFIALFL